MQTVAVTQKYDFVVILVFTLTLIKFEMRHKNKNNFISMGFNNNSKS